MFDDRKAGGAPGRVAIAAVTVTDDTLDAATRPPVEATRPRSRIAGLPTGGKLRAFSIVCLAIGESARYMTPEFFRRLAQQCRDLMRQARAEPTRRQLAIWIEEFEARATAAERAAERNHYDNC
jgi:hypothetical protein